MPSRFEWDDAAFIADGLIGEQKRIMSGFKGNKNADAKKSKEALEPKHVALSLIGEPAMYPKLSALLSEFHKKKMTTFLVTNGTFPNALAALDPLPTQLYVSMVAPDEKTYAEVTQQTGAQAKALWKNYLASLKYLSEAGEKTRTVLRMTLARGLNDNNLEGYADLIKAGKPHYVEAKSMVFVGWARNDERGLKLEDMLSMDEIREISGKLAELTGYIIVDEHLQSRIVLLAKDEKAVKNRILKF